jgi:hypothetical protein
MVWMDGAQVLPRLRWPQSMVAIELIGFRPEIGARGCAADRARSLNIVKRIPS